jgi:hypothetical protein
MSRPTLVLDRFAARQFETTNKSVSTVIDFDPVAFTSKVNEHYEHLLASGQPALIDGYAPFCKHIFVPNFTSARASYLKITDEVCMFGVLFMFLLRIMRNVKGFIALCNQNRHLLASGYVARTEKELPVLSRWFPSHLVKAPLATHLDIILYSREQINIENAGSTNGHF